jgi:antitoxin component YwqK of YwqJK toxin-antitoxin module
MVKIIVGFVAAILISCQQKQEIKTIIFAHKAIFSYEGATILIDGKVANGEYLGINNQNDTLFIVSYQNGREHGIHRLYYAKNKPKEIRYFNNGWKQGLHVGFYPNGKKAFEYQYKDDEFHGTILEWTSSGILYRNMNYKNGFEEGRQIIRYSNGKIKSNYIVKNGIRYGLLGTKNCKNVSDSVFATN